MPQERLILCPEARRDAFLEIIGSARQRIRLSMFRCTDFKVMDKLAEALGRGVAVELLLTQRSKGWEKKIRELGLYLESMGARVVRYGVPQVKYHAKYMVADGRVGLITSLNLTKKHFERTCDFVLVTEDPEVARSLDVLFEHDTSTPDLPIPEGLSKRLIIGPDNSRAAFHQLLSAAQSSLRIADHKVSDRHVVELLHAIEARGVQVEVFGHGAIPDLKSHGKALVIDDSIAALGSVSLSTPSLDSRRELSITQNDPACVAQLTEFFGQARHSTISAALETHAASADADDDGDEDEE